jgi:cystathionine beta-synthase
VSQSPPRPGTLSLIGDTPLVQATRLAAGPCELLLKLESANPGGSIEDRVGLALLDDAEASGALAPGGHVVEAVAGTSGLGLALAAALRGHRLTLVLPDTAGHDTVLHLKALGARCVITRSDVGPDHPQHVRERARRLAADEGAWFADQLGNPAAIRVHEETTGPEIWEQAGHRLDAVVCGVTSGGTLTGLARYFARVAPQVEMVRAERGGGARDPVSPLAELSLASRTIAISEEVAAATARELLRQEGILAGTSSGALVAAALRWCREQTAPRRCVTLIWDRGGAHLSGAFGDAWMDDDGAPRPTTGDLRDLVARRARDGGVIWASPEDTLAVAYARMRASDVSQLPVLEGRRLVGIVDESDLLLAALGDATRGAASFERPVSQVMSLRMETLPPTAGVHQLLPLFDRGMVGIVVEGDELLGLVTRVDLLNYLRRRAG